MKIFYQIKKKKQTQRKSALEERNGSGNGDSTLNVIQETLMGPRPSVSGGHCSRISSPRNTIAGKEALVYSYHVWNYRCETSEVILVEPLQLKLFIEYALPGCKVVTSCPTDRFDDPKSCLTFLHLRRKLNNLQITLISNGNIRDVDIGKKALHLNEGVRQAGSEFYVLYATILTIK